MVVGATGYLGSEVARQAAATGHDVIGTSSADLDITDRAAVTAFFAANRPDVVVNCARRTSSWRVCADGAANVAKASSARLVHISTDALHGGRPERYPDEETPTPVHTYGAAKAAAVAAIDLRPLNVVLDSTRARDILRTRIRAASETLT